jgi:uncharacterized protein DUF1553/uncharacterized protein DUF1549/cytochrome c
MKRLCFVTAVSVVGMSVSVFAGAPSNLEQLDFFEKKIRPVLADSCYECHSANSKKVKGGLLLDTRDGLEKGGDSGPAIVAGNPGKSLLIKTIRHEDKDPDMAMPPKKDKLSDAVIADFEKWVQMGAPDPRDGKSAAAKAAWDDKAKDHWAFKPITNPAVPKAKDAKFSKNEIDAFVLAKLREKKLTPSKQTDRATLIRRVTYDLTGLPPTPEEVDEFVADKSPDAYEKAVDRLLDSPRYGERWARHWLDIARYADTSGDRQGGKRVNPLYSHAWTYRDYVINALNKDLPYDQFIIQQIAADKLPDAEKDKTTLAALGFLTVGKRFMGNANDMIDDEIDVVTKGLMGLTGACARCHDHKFDPIPTKDYYSLHGVFASCQQPEEEPLLADPEKNPNYKDFQAEVEKIEQEVEKYKKTEAARLLGGMLEKSGDYLLAVHESLHTTDAKKKGDNFRLAARQRGLEAEIAILWADRVRDSAKKNDPILGPWFRYAELPENEFADAGPDVTEELVTADASTVHPAIANALAANPPVSLKDVAAIYTEVFARLHDEMKLDHYAGLRGGGAKKAGRFDIAKTEVALADAQMDSLRKSLFSGDSPLMPDEKNMNRALGNMFSTPQGAIRARLVTLEISHPGAPVRAMTIQDKPKPQDSAVLVRGEPGNRGPVVPRQFLRLLAGEDRKPFTDGSGRLDLAKAIASRENPLTARVIVNRVWQWHFGQAIVRTVSDFGTRSEPPTHPELLDYLATWFMDNGWSLKKLHKLIVMSGAYQQDSRPSDRATQTDPTNQFVSHFNIQRLDFEEIRDTLLAIGGNLDLTMGGQPVRIGSSENKAAKSMYGAMDLSTKSNPNRRTIYSLIDRAALPEMFNTFDFANPDMSNGERVLTTVPQQALFMMNSPFVADQVRHFLARTDFPSTGTQEDKVRFIYREFFQRKPKPAELDLAMEFMDNQEAQDYVQSGAGPASAVVANTPEEIKAKARKMMAEKAAQPTKPLDAWERYTQVLLSANELVFLN